MPAERDVFGITKLIPTADGGREWYAAWNNGHARDFDSVDTDPCDDQFHLHGNGHIDIDGHGIARLRGQSPRMYVYDSINAAKWKNVEVTIYGMRISETGTLSYQGFVCGARSEHQAADIDPCNAHTYYARLLYDGRVHFTKEMKHDYVSGEKFYAENRPDDTNRIEWQTADTRMPTLRWIGLKFIVMNLDRDSAVRLSLYIDLANGANGGAWQKLVEIVDTGDWRRDDVTGCAFPADQVWRDAASSVFVRNDALDAADYMNFSAREIQPVR